MRSKTADWKDLRDEYKQGNKGTEAGWGILIVDDDRETHSVTKFALSDYEFEGRGLRFQHAYSGDEAKQVLREANGLAVVLLDIVMESNKAGLCLVDFIRKELKNPFVRIIMRTGQPVRSPEYDLISDYDINEYLNKADLTDTRLCTAITSALRSYSHIQAEELEKVRVSSGS